MLMKTVVCVALVVTAAFVIGGCGDSVRNEHPSRLKTLKIEAPYPKPNIAAMKDGMWVLIEPLSATYYNKNNPDERYAIEVPAGFVMDLASLPKGLGLLAGKYHDLDTAAIIHDYLFWVQPCQDKENGKRIADKLYRDTLKESDNVSWLNAWVQWLGLKSGSWKAWRNNNKRKGAGESRFMPEVYWPQADEQTNWSDLRAECCSTQTSLDFRLADDSICTIKP